MSTIVDTRICPDAPNYTVDTHGIVYDLTKNIRVCGSLDGQSKRKVKLWRTQVQFTIVHDYVTVNLKYDRYGMDLSSIVLRTFVGRPSIGDMVKYSDGNTDNNNVSNLSWISKANVEAAKCVMPVDWVDYCTIPEAPRYAIDKYGNIFNKSTRLEMKQQTDGEGYKFVGLAIASQKTSIRRGVHGCMLRAHVGPPPTRDSTPDHADKNRGNNVLTNLSWASKVEQAANKRHSKKYESGRRIVRTDSAGQQEIYDTREEAGYEIGMTEDGIKTAIHTRYTTRLGYTFAYEEYPLIPGEEWRIIQGDKNNNSVSSEGRVKYARDGRITRGFKSGHYLMVGMSGMGQQHIGVHRIVAQAFVHNANPEKFNIVHHKNHDTSDNRMENLEYTDKKGNADAAVSAGAIKTKPVYQYDLITGEFIKRFDTPELAANTLDCCKASIRACARGDLKSSANFIWSYESSPRVIPKKAVEVVNKPVYQFNLQTGKFIRDFESADEAATSLKQKHASSIRKCARGGTQSSAGFNWSYHPQSAAGLYTSKV